MNSKPLTYISFVLILLFSLLHCGCSAGSQVQPSQSNHTKSIVDAQAKQSEDVSIEWFKAETSDEINDVALVIHGLNLRPDKMKSIISLLTGSGIDVLNLSLRGHGHNYFHEGKVDRGKARIESFKTVSYKLWIDETYRAYKHIWKRGDKKNVSLFFVGFSLGGLLGADLFASFQDVRFDKMVLFAPAFKLHGINYIAKLLSPFPQLVVPSFSSAPYRMNRGTPMAAYNTLFETIKHFKKHLGPKLNIPTIIFIDKQDELVSYRGLKRLVEKEKLDQWKFHLVQKEKPEVKVKMNHIILDEESVGKNMWNKIKNTIINHLLS